MSYNSSLAKLDKLKEKAEKAKLATAKLEGQLDQVMKELRERGFDSVESAEEGLRAVEEEIAKEEGKLERLVAKLEATYGHISK